MAGTSLVDVRLLEMLRSGGYKLVLPRVMEYHEFAFDGEKTLYVASAALSDGTDIFTHTEYCHEKLQNTLERVTNASDVNMNQVRVQIILLTYS